MDIINKLILFCLVDYNNILSKMNTFGLSIILTTTTTTTKNKTKASALPRIASFINIY